uniref:Uncharacterized protein n=1 Tax=Lepeophtheirus salmonis TaxID=72036 RepID=A0A0K2TNJ2_LEPSM
MSFHLLVPFCHSYTQQLLTIFFNINEKNSFIVIKFGCLGQHQQCYVHLEDD